LDDDDRLGDLSNLAVEEFGLLPGCKSLVLEDVALSGWRSLVVDEFALSGWSWVVDELALWKCNRVVKDPALYGERRFGREHVGLWIWMLSRDAGDR
jgi:hypothetical protein